MYIYDINHETNDTYDIKGIRFKEPEINYFDKFFLFLVVSRYSYINNTSHSFPP